MKKMDMVAQFHEIPPLSQGLFWLALVLVFVLGPTLWFIGLSRRKR